MDKILKFYKYQSLVDHQHFVYLQNYLEQKVWMAPLAQFNDPFEGKFSFWISQGLILSKAHIFDNFLKQYRLINGESELTASEFKMRLNSEQFLNSLKNNLPILEFNRHGALCLTRKNNNIPMWAYYADNHKGYCVEFELNFSYLAKVAKNNPDKIVDLINIILKGSGILSRKVPGHPQFFIFTKVRYAETLPSMIFDEFIKLRSRYDQLEYMVNQSVAVKSLDWKHEDEFRLIVNGNSEDSGLLPLGEGLVPFLRVTGIILGNKMEEEKCKHVHNLCLDKKIKLYRAACSNSKYEIIIKPYLNTTKEEQPLSEV